MHPVATHLRTRPRMLFSVVVGLLAALAAAEAGARHAVPHALIALVTVMGSWLLLPTLFTLNYASQY